MDKDDPLEHIHIVSYRYPHRKIDQIKSSQSPKNHFWSSYVPQYISH